MWAAPLAAYLGVAVSRVGRESLGGPRIQPVAVAWILLSGMVRSAGPAADPAGEAWAAALWGEGTRMPGEAGLLAVMLAGLVLAAWGVCGCRSAAAFLVGWAALALPAGAVGGTGLGGSALSGCAAGVPVAAVLLTGDSRSWPLARRGRLPAAAVGGAVAAVLGALGVVAAAGWGLAAAGGGAFIADRAGVDRVSRSSHLAR
jgi:hypothetical protein